MSRNSRSIATIFVENIGCFSKLKIIGLDQLLLKVTPLPFAPFVQMPYKPIQCQTYDYIEIACMRHYLLDVALHTGELIRGTAKNTLIINKEEFLVIEQVDSKMLEIRLDRIKQITPLDHNAEFSLVKIS